MRCASHLARTAHARNPSPPPKTASQLLVHRDSHIKQIYAALRCFMTDFWAHSQGECAASPEEALQFQLDDVTAAEQPYRTPPRCLHLKGGSGARICLVHSPKGDMFLDGNPEVRRLAGS